MAEEMSNKISYHPQSATRRKHVLMNHGIHRPTLEAAIEEQIGATAPYEIIRVYHRYDIDCIAAEVECEEFSPV